MDARRGRRDPGVRRREPAHRDRHADPARDGQDSARRQRPLHVGHQAPGAARGRRPAQPARQREADGDRRRGRTRRARRPLRRHRGRRPSGLRRKRAVDRGARVRRRRRGRGRRRERRGGRGRAGSAGAAVGGARLHHRYGCRRRRPALHRGSDRVRARRRRRSPGGRSARRRGRVPGAGPAAQQHGAPLRRRRVARRGPDGVELDPGDLRGPRGAGPGVRHPGRAGARDLRVHGRRVRVEVRRRARGCPGSGARQAQPASCPAGLLPARGESDRRLPVRGPRRAAAGRRRGRDAPRHRGVGRHGSGQRRLDVPDPGADEGCLQM